MAIYASKSKKGFYDDSIHSALPDDALEISQEYHAELLAAQSAGKVISWNGDLPTAEDPPALSFEQEVVVFKTAIQAHMDAAAKASGYDDIKTAVTYAEEPSVAKFQAEGQAFRAWRSLVWAYGYEQLALVASGGRTKPTVAELVAELPKLVLPTEQTSAEAVDSAANTDAGANAGAESAPADTAGGTQDATAGSADATAAQAAAVTDAETTVPTESAGTSDAVAAAADTAGDTGADKADAAPQDVPQ